MYDSQFESLIPSILTNNEFQKKLNVQMSNEVMSEDVLPLGEQLKIHSLPKDTKIMPKIQK